MVRITDEGASPTNAKALVSDLTERTSSNESSYCRPMLLASIPIQIGFQFGIAMVNSGLAVSIRTTQRAHGSNSARPMPTSFACHQDRVRCVQLAQESNIRHQILSQVFTTETDDRAQTASSFQAQGTRRAASWRRPKSSKLRSNAGSILRKRGRLWLPCRDQVYRISLMNSTRTSTGVCPRYSIRPAHRSSAHQVSRNNS
jgi:hypothetical protein